MSPLIKKGSNNKWVKVAKYLMGYNTAGKATTTFDSKFKTFVVKWQKANGLVADGEIGNNTWSKIALQSPTLTDKTKTGIYAFQIACGLTVNGAYNTATKNMIKNIQKGCGYEVNGVCDYKVWKEIIAKPKYAYRHTVNYKQNDKRWGDIMYSVTNNPKQQIKNSGCGSTTLADIVASLRDSSITPVEASKFAIECGARRKTGGTDPLLFEKAKDKWKFKASIKCNSLFMAQHCLDCGGYVAVSVGKGYFTSSGHWMCIWKITSSTVYVDNPISNIKVSRAISKFTPEVNYYVCMYP